MFAQVIQGPVADREALHAAFDRWVEELAPGSIGWLGATAGVTEDGTCVVIARFEDAEQVKPIVIDPSRTSSGPRRPSCSPAR